jgi:alkanesulfonate monooxygenase SsuD/methylene tetrahydromethanopterin reductase-like flavin-dependent oxidoreductase (luciferase family)
MVTGTETVKRVYLGVELVGMADRYPSRMEDDSEEHDVAPLDLGSIARLARTAQRGRMDFFIVDDTLAGNPPFSGRRRSALDAVRLATRLAPATDGILVVPEIRSSWVEPTALLESLVALEMASQGRHAWQLSVQDKTAPAMHGAELLSAIVEDTWSSAPPLTRIAAVARAQRLRRLGEGTKQDADAATGRKSQTTRSRSDLRPPSRPGAPVLAVRCEGDVSTHFGAVRADITRIRAATLEEARAQRTRIRELAKAAKHNPDHARVFADMTVALARVEADALARRDLTEAITGRTLGEGEASFVGTPDGLAAMITQWVDEGACDGFTVRPTSLPVDLMLMVDAVIPELQRARRFPTVYKRHRHQPRAPKAIPLSSANRRKLAAKGAESSG